MVSGRADYPFLASKSFLLVEQSKYSTFIIIVTVHAQCLDMPKLDEPRQLHCHYSGMPRPW